MTDQLENDDDGAAPRASVAFAAEAGDVEAAVKALAQTHGLPIDEGRAWSAFNSDALGLRGPLKSQLQLAFSYQLEMEANDRPGCELLVNEYWPTPVSDVPHPVIELWAEIALQVTAPAAIARLEDLLFCRGVGNGLERVQRAVAAYLQAANDADDEFIEAEHLLRAWTLARRVKSEKMQGQAVKALSDVVARSMQETPIGVGVLLPMLATLTASGSTITEIDLDEALASLATASHNTYVASRVAALRRKRVSVNAAAPSLDDINRDELDFYEGVAERATHPMVQAHDLENAVRRATELGMTTDARRLTSQLQELGPAVLRSLQSFTTEGEMPRARAEAFTRRFTRSATLVEALEEFLYSINPGGRLTTHREFAESGRKSIRRVFGSGLLGRDGLTRARESTDEQQDRHDMQLSTRLTAEVFGDLLADSLLRMIRRYDTPTEKELVDALLALHVRNPRNALFLAKALRHFWEQDFDACVHLAVPRFEGAARELLLELRVGIYRVPSGNDPGDYPGLYGILKELEELAIDDEWSWFFHWLMLGPGGRGLRSDVAHGDGYNVGPVYAALALRALAVMALAAPVAEDSDRWRTTPIRPVGIAAIPDTILRIASLSLGRSALRLEGLRARLANRSDGRSKRPAD